MRERLHKILSARGVASRREAERLMAAGRVSVNGRVTREPGASADPERDVILFDGKPLTVSSPLHVLMLHKPPGFLCTARKGRERGRTIYELAPRDTRYFSVGRLDRDSSGLILLTNDGRLAYRLTHPRHGTPKTYLVETRESLAPQQIARLRTGILLEDGVARAKTVTRLGPRRLRIVLTEGRNRQIRRMIAALGTQVVALHRVRIGSIALGNLAPGAWRKLTSAEVSRLMGPDRTGERGGE